ncbi:MAG: hypothetical protein R3302_06145 [Sulfurimonadaceae bacterium]|nr:hypothetical protein [Sulfurimonadaceae bacterium]
MRHLFIVLAFLGISAFACSGCGCNGPVKSGYNKSTMGTLHYALNIMKLHDDPQVQMALEGYKRHVASMPRGMDTDAFKNGAFDRNMFIQKSRKVQKVNAQADLFENIYKILDSEQKQQLHRLMAAHQYYVGGMDQQGNCGKKQACKSEKPCASKCGQGKCGDGKSCPSKAEKKCQCPGDGSCGCKEGQPCKCEGGKSCGCDGKPACDGKQKGDCPSKRSCPN